MSVAVVNPPLLKTPLNAWHAAHRGRMVEFGGWQMPVQYDSIVAEHQAVRTRAGLFDISHMGRLKFGGPSALPFLEGLLTRRVADLGPGQVRYSLVTKDDGGILDDVLIYRLAPEQSAGQEKMLPAVKTAGYGDYFLVVNASNRLKIVDWIRSRSNSAVEFADLTLETAMIAVQGPAAEKILQPLVDIALAGMKYYHAAEGEVCGHRAVVSRTGYTGEDGFEVTVAGEFAVEVWEAILAAGSDAGAVPAGLGARDTLRLEAAMPLYGHELNEEIDPLTAGLGFAVNLDGREFPGHAALVNVKEAPRDLRRVGLELEGRRPAREHYSILQATGSSEPEPVGEITSGTFSPTFERPIAMGYVKASAATVGTQLLVDIRGQQTPAKVVKLPFYRRK